MERSSAGHDREVAMSLGSFQPMDSPATTRDKTASGRISEEQILRWLSEGSDEDEIT